MTGSATLLKDRRCCWHAPRWEVAVGRMIRGAKTELAAGAVDGAESNSTLKSGPALYRARRWNFFCVMFRPAPTPYSWLNTGTSRLMCNQ